PSPDGSRRAARLAVIARACGFPNRGQATLNNGVPAVRSSHIHERLRIAASGLPGSGHAAVHGGATICRAERSACKKFGRRRAGRLKCHAIGPTEALTPILLRIENVLRKWNPVVEISFRVDHVER